MTGSFLHCWCDGTLWPSIEKVSERRKFSFIRGQGVRPEAEFLALLRGYCRHELSNLCLVFIEHSMFVAPGRNAGPGFLLGISSTCILQFSPLTWGNSSRGREKFLTPANGSGVSGLDFSEEGMLRKNHRNGPWQAFEEWCRRHRVPLAE